MKKTISTFFVLIALGVFSISAMALSTHSVWTNDNGNLIIDAKTKCEYQSFAGFNMASSWTEPAPPTYPAVAHLRGVTKAYSTSRGCFDRDYEFKLVSASATSADEIKGNWDVYRDGSLVCSNCAGLAAGLSNPVGNAYKVLIDDPVYGPATWLFSGFIDNRKDF